jgi:hypothetical protein
MLEPCRLSDCNLFARRDGGESSCKMNSSPSQVVPSFKEVRLDKVVDATRAAIASGWMRLVDAARDATASGLTVLPDRSRETRLERYGEVAMVLWMRESPM